MQIFVMVKAAGKRRPILEKVTYEIPDTVSTLKDLLTELVRIEVEKYNQKEKDMQLIPFLTDGELEEQAQTGKVGFGRIYSDKKADFQKALENALQCWQDGLVRIFVNDDEIELLENPLQISEGDCLTLIRLTFLAGRMW